MKRIALLAVTAALGLAAALGYTAKTAQAYDIAALPAPYTVDLLSDGSAQSGCRTFYVVHWYDRSATIGFGPSIDGHFSDCNSQFQQQLDAFVAATINLTPPVATTAPVTTTAPPATTTAPVVTTAAAPTAPAPAATVTVTTVITDPTINSRLTTLETNYAALSKRVDAVANANTASWDAFSAKLAAGGTVAEAALAARSAGWNAIYLL